MKFLSLLLSTFIPLALGFAEDESGQWVKLLNLPQTPVAQKSSACQLNGQTVADFITNNPNTPVVLIVKTSTSDNFADNWAQLLATRNITVCQLSLSAGQTSIYGTDGSVVVVVNGKQYSYHGRRSPSALLSYVLKLNTSHVRLITGKLDKMAYDLVAGPKLVGFFMPATPDLAAYETAALKYSPNIPFYLVADRTVAKHLKLSVVGQINLVKPFEKVAVTCPVNPATALDIDSFIEANKGVILKYVTEQNLFDPELQDPNRTTVIAIGDRSTAVGQYFYKILTKTIRTITRENTVIQTLLANAAANAATVAATGTVTPTAPVTQLPSIIDLNAIEILWIDPQVFPSISVYLDQIRTQNGLAEGLEIYLGAVKPEQSVWLDTNQINRTADKTSDETNLQLLKNWITQVIANQTTLPALPEPAVASDSTVQSFLKEPQTQTVAEGSQLVLECQVSGQVGDCLWLKDGQNIGFNLARISPHYRWRGVTGSGDCSLVIASVSDERDSGEWVCEVTGDANNPTITSAAAIIAVNPKKEL